MPDLPQHELGRHARLHVLCKHARDVYHILHDTRCSLVRHPLQSGTLFVETSAKANVAVSQAFEELVAKVLDTPSLLQVLKRCVGACSPHEAHVPAPAAKILLPFVIKQVTVSCGTAGRRRELATPCWR